MCLDASGTASTGCSHMPHDQRRLLRYVSAAILRSASSSMRSSARFGTPARRCRQELDIHDRAASRAAPGEIRAALQAIRDSNGVGAIAGLRPAILTMLRPSVFGCVQPDSRRIRRCFRPRAFSCRADELG